MGWETGGSASLLSPSISSRITPVIRARQHRLSRPPNVALHQMGDVRFYQSEKALRGRITFLHQRQIPPQVERVSLRPHTKLDLTKITEVGDIVSRNGLVHATQSTTDHNGTFRNSVPVGH